MQGCGLHLAYDPRHHRARLFTITHIQIAGNFLLYQEVENKIPKPKHESYNKKDRRVVDMDGTQEVTGSKGTYRVKRDGLMKKTIAVQLNQYDLMSNHNAFILIVLSRCTYHLVSYFLAEARESLPTPSAHAPIASLPIGSDLLLGQGFRRPLDVNGKDIICAEQDSLDYEWGDPFGNFEMDRQRMSSIGSSTIFGSNSTSYPEEETPPVLALQLTAEDTQMDESFFSASHSFFVPMEELNLETFTFEPIDSMEPEFSCSTRLPSDGSMLLSQLDDLLEMSDPDHLSLPMIPRMTRFPEDYIKVTAAAPEKDLSTISEETMLSLESLIHLN